MESSKKSSWGGARPGAGRKKGVPTGRPKVRTCRIYATTSPENYARAKAYARAQGCSLSTLIDRYFGELPDPEDQ